MLKSVIFFSLCFLSGCTAILTNGAHATINTDRRSSSTVLMDAALEIEVKHKLNELALDDDSRIHLKSFNRHIIVLGQTPQHEDIEKISSLLASTDGVKKIYNEVTPQKSINRWQKMQDKWITAKIKSSMLVTPHVNPWRLHVMTENNIVYLIGIIKPEEEEAIVNIAKTTSGVTKVVKIFEYKQPAKES
jgi:osmotically-inducible protein OsmY